MRISRFMSKEIGYMVISRPFREKYGTRAAFCTRRSFCACDRTHWKSVKIVTDVSFQLCYNVSIES